ncbi:hypothetical protein FB451DRAFT_1536691 [Mycena latifolia]|nr:hypothetical protein FB451DRAFT_1536691 [Mycena latifolia]
MLGPADGASLPSLAYLSHFVNSRYSLFVQYLLLFPNEMYAPERGGRSGGDAKNALWALFCRSMLLAHFCRTEGGVARDASDPGRARRTRVQSADRGRVFVQRERVQAEEWMASSSVPERSHPARHAVHPVPLRSAGDTADAAPVCGYVSLPHLSYFCLLLWENDTSLGAAQCATFLVPREVMNALWAFPSSFLPPSPPFFPAARACADFCFADARFWWLEQCDPALHKRLAAHSRSAGVESPCADGGDA